MENQPRFQPRRSFIERYLDDKRDTPKFILEFIGSFIVVFTIHLAAPHQFGAFAIATSFFVAVLISAKVSGANLNSAVTLLCFLNNLSRHEPIKSRVYVNYVLHQIAGGVAAGLVAMGLGSNLVKLEFAGGSLQAVVLECIYTCLLCLIVCMASDPNYAPPIEPALVGLLVAGLIFVQAVTIGPLTGGVVNPSIGVAITFTRAIRYGVHELVASWIYIVGPCLGALIAYFIYQNGMKPALTPAKPQVDKESKHFELRDPLVENK
eukprot:TRINITY_DN7823_c0_g1_i1.p1 TRINITY_DN7823_c0_g1~~TRINITY_DN7823_c0_g1_i1.p1  ORF type:complete len:264 (-),score=43.06 TRINITY_DN7823_c0_g1_i1:176-967(-)